jgi:hypothetical protein
MYFFPQSKWGALLKKLLKESEAKIVIYVGEYTVFTE